MVILTVLRWVFICGSTPDGTKKERLERAGRKELVWDWAHLSLSRELQFHFWVQLLHSHCWVSSKIWRGEREEARRVRSLSKAGGETKNQSCSREALEICWMITRYGYETFRISRMSHLIDVCLPTYSAEWDRDLLTASTWPTSCFHLSHWAKSAELSEAKPLKQLKALQVIRQTSSTKHPKLVLPSCNPELPTSLHLSLSFRNLSQSWSDKFSMHMFDLKPRNAFSANRQGLALQLHLNLLFLTSLTLSSNVSISTYSPDKLHLPKIILLNSTWIVLCLDSSNIDVRVVISVFNFVLPIRPLLKLW